MIIESNSFNKRIAWVDIFKGVVIILMVLGHSTGRFNIYIYQFHMAAFFFISGFTSNLSKTWFDIAWNKFCTLILPLVTVFVLSFFVYKLFGALFPTLELNKPFSMDLQTSFIFREALLAENFYLSWLGACWFLTTLFKTVLFSKLLTWLTAPNVKLYFAFSIISAVYGFSISLQDKRAFFNMDLVYIANLFFAAGVIFKEYRVFDFIREHIFKVVCLLTPLIMFYVGRNSLVLMDWPSRSFSVLLALDFLVVINDIIFIFAVTFLIERFSCLKRLFIFLGRNTLPIVFFHFLLFKVSYLILGVSVENFTPPPLALWTLLVIIPVSVGGSIVLWKVLMKLPYMAFFLGDGKKTYKKLGKILYDKLTMLEKT